MTGEYCSPWGGRVGHDSGSEPQPQGKVHEKGHGAPVLSQSTARSQPSCVHQPRSSLNLVLWVFVKTSLHIHGRLNLRAATAAAKSLQSCLTLCNPIDGSPPGSPVPGILQARTLEWVAISFSNAWKWKVKVKSLSRVLLFVTPWTAAYQAPPSMGFSRQEYWRGVPLPSPNLWALVIKSASILSPSF